jgi:hypothetical protein
MTAKTSLSRCAAASALLLTLLGGCTKDDNDGDEPSGQGGAGGTMAGGGGGTGGAGSAGAAGGTGAGGAPPKACNDPKYGDGVCQLDVACDAPDIDCFLTFADQASVEAWFTDTERQLAEAGGRPPRAIVPSSDARWIKMRALLDKGWQSYQSANKVGDLAKFSPALVVVDDPTVNAFALADLASERSGFAVMVHTATLDADTPEGPMLGLVMHELEHAVGLHLIQKGQDRFRRFYVARGGKEPLGAAQAEDPVAREYGTKWRDLASDVGVYDHEDLGGIPVGPENGVARVLSTAIKARLQEPGADQACGEATQALGQVGAAILGRMAKLDGAYVPGQPLRPAIDETLELLRDDCLGDEAPSFVDVLAALQKVTPEQILADLPKADRDLVEGRHIVDAVASIAIARRAAMRAIEADFTAATGEPWSSLRFYSTEEAADDATVPVLRGADLKPDALGDFFLTKLAEPDTAGACADVLDANQVPPYGVDLFDEHHAVCYRIYHVRTVAAAGAPGGAKLTAQHDAFVTPRAPGRRLLPPSLSDRIVIH